MATGSGIITMGRNEDIEAPQFAAKQKLIDALIQSAIAEPQRPELSWTQGAARLAQALMAGYQQHQLNNQRQTYLDNRTHDMGLLTQALMQPGGASNIPSVVSQMHDPITQQMALSTAANQIAFQQALQQKRFENQLDIGKNTAKEFARVAADQNLPDNVAKNNIAATSDIIRAMQAKLQAETDPQKKAQLQQQLGLMQNTQNQFINQMRTTKGQVPDEVGLNTNAYLQNLNAGVQPLPGQRAAYLEKKMPAGPESAFEQAVGTQAAQPIKDLISQFNNQAKASNDATRISDQALQEMAMNPNLTAGPGTELQTKIMSALNKFMPGLINNNADQQAFQKNIGQFVLSGAQQLHSSGVQRLTQQELQYVIPMFNPTMMNTKEGLKNILETFQAMNPVIQDANQRMTQLTARYNRDPNFDIGTAQAQLMDTTRQALSQATMNYYNAKLAPSGQKLIINPDYNPTTNPTNKYIRVGTDQNGNVTQIMPGQISASDIKADPKLLTPVFSQNQTGNQANNSDQNAVGNNASQGQDEAQKQLESDMSKVDQIQQAPNVQNANPSQGMPFLPQIPQTSGMQSPNLPSAGQQITPPSNQADLSSDQDINSSDIKNVNYTRPLPNQANNQPLPMSTNAYTPNPSNNQIPGMNLSNGYDSSAMYSPTMNPSNALSQQAMLAAMLRNQNQASPDMSGGQNFNFSF